LCVRGIGLIIGLLRFVIVRGRTLPDFDFAFVIVRFFLLGFRFLLVVFLFLALVSR
jgi:hypothetical protein